MFHGAAWGCRVRAAHLPTSHGKRRKNEPDFYDLTGSYGVNVFGADFYKECMKLGSEKVEAVGATLGAYHPCVAFNVKRLKEISGLDQVSFHMSGTEAVMQAVRLARYHTGRKTAAHLGLSQIRHLPTV